MKFKHKAKIVFIIPSSVLGGHEFQTAEIINKYMSEFSESEVSVLVANECFLERLSKLVHSKVRIYSFPQGNLLYLLSKSISVMRILKENINCGDEIIVSGGTVETAIYYSLLMKILFKHAVECVGYIPMYVDKRLLRPRLGCIHNLVIDLAGKVVDRYITINRIQAKIINYHFQRPVSVIRNKVTTYSPVESDFGPRLVYCGRLDDTQKNVSSLIELLDDPRNPYAELHIFGDGPAKCKVESSAAACKHLTVVMHGWCSGDDIHQHLGRRDILVMNSRWEGEPLVIREFSSRGIPAVVPDICGFRGIGINKNNRFTTCESLYEILNKTYHKSSVRGE
ncbi:glycosyltransferase [Aeromonas rivipollensis]|uniref:glycosyltransferase n=1 Tax=Aeromonas rivipollensis TaxID=948519 RepID=UPI0038D10448